MKHLLIFALILMTVFCKAVPPDSLSRRKHFALEADVAYAHAKINPRVNLFGNQTMGTLKAPGFMCYNLALVYNGEDSEEIVVTPFMSFR